MAFNKDKVMDSARKFVDKGQIDKAVKEYLRIVQEDPRDVRVWLKIGDLYAKKGSKQDAIETYLKVARFYHEQGFFLKAVAVYKQILKLDARLVDVILRLAELYRQLGQMSEAMQHYESVAAHFHREGNTREALATVKKLVELDPENIATRIKLAELYSKEGLVGEAATEFGVACEQLRRQGRQDDFLKVAERLLWHQPDNHALNRELAGLYLRRNDPRRALQKLQACFKADPRDIETLGLLAQAFQALDQKAKTVSVLKELARVHVENKQRDRATEVYRKILEFVPSDADALEFLGPAAAPPQPPSRPTPPPRPTPLPAQVRAASPAANFNLTGDLRSLAPASASMTGSMPLVDEQSLAGADFALPEYDDADFSANMEPAPDPRQMSAAGERHAEEISKILAETDVYVKYGLHQKAVDHLRRVFTLDAENVEAHERLKDIFVSQGREQEAEAELLRLAELVAASDPDRAEAYLQELLAVNGTHTGAFELARRFQLRVGRNGSASQDTQYVAGRVAPIELELDELALDEGPRSTPRPMGVARGGARDSIDDFDPDELIGGRIAHGSPAPGRPPQRPASYDDNFAIDFEPSGATRQLSPEQAAALVASSEVDALELRPAGPGWAGDERTRYSPQSAFDALDAQLAEDDDIDSAVARELAGQDLPFDPDEARRFDAAVTSGGGASQTSGPVFRGFSEVDISAVGEQVVLDASSYEPVPQDALSISGSYDPYGTNAAQTPVYDRTVARAEPPAREPVELHAPEAARAESLVEDDLEEADFYAGQGLYPEAIDSLNTLLARYPGHPLLIGKLRELEALARGGDLDDPLALGTDTPLPPVAGGTTDALELDEIEEVDVDELEEIDPSISQAGQKKKRGPQVMLEKPIDEGDADTHYDLGLAYKEMGLYDEAIGAFEKALRSPSREVDCRVMVGMCLREQGNASEAILQFKQGLHASPSDRERQSLYYEIAATYEAIGDVGEAIYYFEMVLKRDPGFADVNARVAALRAGGGQPQHRDLDD